MPFQYWNLLPWFVFAFSPPHFIERTRFFFFPLVARLVKVRLQIGLIFFRPNLSIVFRQTTIMIDIYVGERSPSCSQLLPIPFQCPLTFLPSLHRFLAGYVSVIRFERKMVTPLSSPCFSLGFSKAFQDTETNLSLKFSTALPHST